MSQDREELRTLNGRVHAFRAMFQDYPVLEAIREDLHMLLERDNTSAEGGVMTLIGPSGCGKTKFVEEFMQGFPRQKHAIRHDDGRISDRATVVMVAVPDTGIKTLAEAIYTELTGFDPPADRRIDLQKAIYHYTVEMETKLIIFEEAHEASVDETNKTVKAVARLFKQFSNKATFAVLIVGTEEADRLIRTNRELGRRVLAKHEIPPLGWDQKRSRKVFLGLLKSWDALLQDALTPAGLDSEELAVKIHLSSDMGVIGLAAVLVERAALLAVRDKVAGKTRGKGREATPILGIDEAHLHEAHRLLGRPDPNPFSLEVVNGVASAPVQADEAAANNGDGRAAKGTLARSSSRRAAKDRIFRP